MSAVKTAFVEKVSGIIETVLTVQDTKKWAYPWRAIAGHDIRNGISGRPYGPFNAVSLMASFPKDQIFLTEHQIRKANEYETKDGATEKTFLRYDEKGEKPQGGEVISHFFL